MSTIVSSSETVIRDCVSPVRFGVYTVVEIIEFYAAARGVVYYGRQRSLFEAAFAAATASPILIALLGIGLLVKHRFRQSEFSE